jgi:hypothetical protein
MVVASYRQVNGPAQASALRAGLKDDCGCPKVSETSRRRLGPFNDFSSGRPEYAPPSRGRRFQGANPNH